MQRNVITGLSFRPSLQPQGYKTTLELTTNSLNMEITTFTFVILLSQPKKLCSDPPIK